MRYILQAVETFSQKPYEEEVKSKQHYEERRKELIRVGYSDFDLDERFSNLDEMYDLLLSDESIIRF